MKIVIRRTDDRIKHENEKSLLNVIHSQLKDCISENINQNNSLNSHRCLYDWKRDPWSTKSYTTFKKNKCI